MMNIFLNNSVSVLVCVLLPPSRWPSGFQDPHWGRLGPLQDLVLKAGDPGSGASPAPRVRCAGREAPPLSCAVSPQGSFRTSAGSKAPPTPAPEVQRPVQAAKKESKEPKKVTHSPSWAGAGARRPSLRRGDDTARVMTEPSLFWKGSLWAAQCVWCVCLCPRVNRQLRAGALPALWPAGPGPVHPPRGWCPH